MAQAPGVNVSILAAATSPVNQSSTSNWFVTGMAAGPAGVAVPVKSMQDFTNFFGQNINGGLTGRYTLNASVDSTLLYDSLDTFFHEGGSMAYVSRIQPTSAGVAAASPTLTGKFILTALGKGTWANSSAANTNGLILTLTGYTINASTAYSASLAYNGIVTATTSGLVVDQDVVNWINSLTPYMAMCTAAIQTGTTILPVSGSSVSVYLTGGTDVAVVDADAVAALAVFNNTYGPGQVSYPGSTSTATYGNLTNHALAFNRVAFCDAPNTATAATVVASAASLQASATDPSYGALFAPWVLAPGIVTANPSVNVSPVFNRTVPPSAFAAALVAQIDATSDCNVPAAGTKNGDATWLIGVTQTFVDSDRGALDGAGVSVIRFVPNINVIALYGFKSLAFGNNWNSLANVRFRMQVTRDLDAIGEDFVFQEIDGKGQIFAAFQGALSGQLQAYWGRGSLYGATADDAFSINTGSALNTPTTIANGQLNAAISLRMSPYAEYVSITITKYLASSNLPVIIN